MNKYEKAYNKTCAKIEVSLLNENELILQELIERATPKKVIIKEYGTKYCPNCNRLADDVINGMQFEFPYCRDCGQALDWTD